MISACRCLQCWIKGTFFIINPNYTLFMKSRFILFLAFLCLGAGVSYAQITTGKPSSKVIRTGNRAEAGDFGLYFGATTPMFKSLFDKDMSLEALPLINFKYMASNHVEARLGLELYKTSTRLNGDMKSSSSANDGTSSVKNTNVDANVMLYPGFAYHFSKLNIFDVYVGAELPLGWNRESNVSTSSYDSERHETTRSKNSFVIGLGAFVGVQAFIADLPLALGVEYGVSSRLDTGLKYKYVSTSGETTQTIYSPDPSAFPGNNGNYTKLNARKGEIGGQLRLTITYYFK